MRIGLASSGSKGSAIELRPQFNHLCQSSVDACGGPSDCVKHSLTKGSELRGGTAGRFPTDPLPNFGKRRQHVIAVFQWLSSRWKLHDRAAPIFQRVDDVTNQRSEGFTAAVLHKPDALVQREIVRIPW